MKTTIEKMMNVGKLILVGVIGLQLCMVGIPQEAQAWSLKKAFKSAVKTVTKPVQTVINKAKDEVKRVANDVKHTVQNTVQKATDYARNPGKLVKSAVNFVKKHKEEFLVGALTVGGALIGVDPMTVRTLYNAGKQAYNYAKTGKFDKNALISVGGGFVAGAIGMSPATIEKGINMGKAAYQMAKKGKVDPQTLLTMGAQVAKVAGVPTGVIQKGVGLGQKAIAAHQYLADSKNRKALKNELGQMFLKKALTQQGMGSIKDFKTAQSWVRQAGKEGKAFLNAHKNVLKQHGALLTLKKFQPVPTGWKFQSIPRRTFEPIPTGWMLARRSLQRTPTAVEYAKGLGRANAVDMFRSANPFMAQPTAVEYRKGATSIADPGTTNPFAAVPTSVERRGLLIMNGRTNPGPVDPWQRRLSSSDESRGIVIQNGRPVPPPVDSRLHKLAAKTVMGKTDGLKIIVNGPGNRQARKIAKLKLHPGFSSFAKSRTTRPMLAQASNSIAVIADSR